MRTYVRDRIGQFASTPDGGPVGRGGKVAPKSVGSGSMSARVAAGPTKGPKGTKHAQMKRSTDAATGGHKFRVVNEQRTGGPPPSPWVTYSDAGKPHYIVGGQTIRGVAPKPYYTADGQTIRGPLPRTR